MPLNASPHPRLPNNHLAGTSGLVTAKMQHPVALLNPLSRPITQEPSQATLKDTEEGVKVARATDATRFLKRANENTSATDRGYSNTRVKPLSLF